MFPACFALSPTAMGSGSCWGVKGATGAGGASSAAENDGDYHIQISPTHNDAQGTDFLIIEVPTPETEFVADASLHAPLEAVRSLIRERVLQGREPSTRGSVLTHPACVEVAGQLFYDDAHVGDQPRGKRGMKAATLWELHPVTHIAFSRGCTQ